MKIKGATVLLTGGIGHAIARRLKADGADLILTGRNADVLAPLAAELRARSIVADLGDAADVDGVTQVVLIGSMSGIIASPVNSLYAATKFGLRGFAAGVVKAIVKNRGEIVVAPVELRIGARFGSLFPSVNDAAQRRAGALEMVSKHAYID